MSFLDGFRKGLKDSSAKEPTRREKVFFSAAFLVLFLSWLGGFISWYWCILPGLIVVGCLAPASAQRDNDRDKPSVSATSPAPAQGVTLPCTFAFSYQAQDGRYSRRTVNVNSISSNGEHVYLDGFCYDRMDSRTFRTDRILGDLTDTETGELLPVARLLSSVRTRTSMDYKPPAPAPRSRSAAREWQTAVFFAGFRGGKLNELEGLADAAGWQVRGAISHSVDYVVRNGSAGKKQLAEAENLGIPVIDEDTFRTLL